MLSFTPRKGRLADQSPTVKDADGGELWFRYNNPQWRLRIKKHADWEEISGGFLGSATETYLKLEMMKFLKMLRHFELLPRDLSGIFLQQFMGTVNIVPKSRVSDFYYILVSHLYNAIWLVLGHCPHLLREM